MRFDKPFILIFSLLAGSVWAGPGGLIVKSSGVPGNFPEPTADTHLTIPTVYDFSVALADETAAGAAIAVLPTSRYTFSQVLLGRDYSFAVSSAVLGRQFSAKLKELAVLLKSQPQTTAIIVGHADSSGPDAFNQKLSEARALAVARKLLQLGVDRSQLQVTGKSSSEPVASNLTAEGRARNRRVDVRILSFEPR